MLIHVRNNEVEAPALSIVTVTDEVGVSLMMGWTADGSG